jgi:hypothetical protein
MSNIDCTNATIYGGITAYDQRNASLYTQYKWMKQRCDDLALNNPKDFVWINRFTDGSTSYYCPPGLTGCYEGNCFINSENECNKHSVYGFNTDSKGEPNGLGATGSNIYLEYRMDKHYPENGYNCYIGNQLLRRWCTSPESDIRGEGKNNKPAFYYNPHNGNCYLTKKYCKAMGEQYNGPDVVDPQLKAIDSSVNPSYASTPLDEIGGSCYVPPGQKFAETLFGKTLVRTFTGGCDQALSSLSDRRYKEDIKLLVKDYGGKGINLYSFIYKPEVKKMHPEYKSHNIGFLADEIQKIYPELIENRKGILYITIEKDKLKDKKYWRIYNTLKMKKEILNLLLNKILENGHK